MLARQGSRSRCARWSRSGSPTSSGSLENLLDPDRLQLDVVVAGGGAAGEVGRAGLRPRPARRRKRRRRSGRRARRPRVSRTPGGPPTRDATTERLDAIASSVASPKGSTSSAGRGRRRPRPTPGPHRGPRARRPEFRADPRAHRAAARLRRTQARPRRVARTRARRSTFFRSERAPRQRNAVPPRSGSSRARPVQQPRPAARSARDPPRSRRPRSCPARRAPPVRAARSQPDTATTAAARRTT